MNHQKFKYTFLTFCIFMLGIHAYIDITMAEVTSSADVALNMPVTIGGYQYHIAVSLHQQDDFIVLPASKSPSKKVKAVKNAKEMEMHVWSLQGYTLQGWKRFFMEVFLFEDSKYSHTINLNLENIKKLDKKMTMTNGIMSLGPSLQDNQFYQLIKEQTKEYFKQDIVSFFTTPGNKDVRMQLGGYQDQNAQGYSNGVRFYQKSMQTTEEGSDWALPVAQLLVSRQKNDRWQTFSIPRSSFTPKLSIQSQYVILPSSLKEDLQTSFESQNIECQFSTSTTQLQCSNSSSIDEALTFLSLSFDKDVHLNISLYDLRDQYNAKSKVTSYFVKLSNKSEDYQIGSPVLKGYYISLNLQKQTFLFSPLNRFSPEISTAQIIRFIVIFMGFMLAFCIGIVVWQQFNMPTSKRNRFTRGKDGVRLVAYQRAGEMEDDL